MADYHSPNRDRYNGMVNMNKVETLVPCVICRGVGWITDQPPHKRCPAKYQTPTGIIVDCNNGLKHIDDTLYVPDKLLNKVESFT